MHMVDINTYAEDMKLSLQLVICLTFGGANMLELGLILKSGFSIFHCSL